MAGAKQRTRLTKGAPAPSPSASANQRLRMVDARNKIIMKKRNQLVDARDRLAELARKTDARAKLDDIRRRQNRIPFVSSEREVSESYVKIGKRPRIPRLRFDALARRQIRQTPVERRPYGSSDDVIMEDFSPMITPIVRSVKNDLSRRRSSSTFDAFGKRSIRNDIVVKPTFDNRKSNLNLKVVARNFDNNPVSEGILKRDYKNRMNERISSPVSILKKRQPDPNGSSSKDTFGYRILVSNLQSSVTANDINELFGDIGKLVYSKLVRPGTAEVIYSSLKDAQKAVDVYHNRQLDGQPMNCFLVNPRNTTNSLQTSSMKPSSRHLPASSNSSVVPDVSTVHKVLFYSS